MTVECKIYSYEEDTDEFGVSHVYFNVMVKPPQSNAHVIRKRYSDFEHLYTALRERIDQPYAFPNKSLFNNRAAFTLERRVQGFTELLQIAVRIRPLPDEVPSFLEIPAPPLRVSTTAGAAERAGGGAGGDEVRVASPPTPASASSSLSPPPRHLGSPPAPAPGHAAAEARVKAYLPAIVGAALAVSVAASVVAVRSGAVDVSQSTAARCVTQPTHHTHTHTPRPTLNPSPPLFAG